MAKTFIDIDISSPYTRKIRVSWLKKVANEAMQVSLTGPHLSNLEKQDRHLSLAITDDNTIRRLNLRFRGLDYVTDVLSFSTISQGYWKGDRVVNPQNHSEEPFPIPPYEPQPLGEVIISYPQAERQALASCKDIKKELSLLVVHGVLHLLGYDHESLEEAASMQKMEQQTLIQLKI